MIHLLQPDDSSSSTKRFTTPTRKEIGIPISFGNQWGNSGLSHPTHAKLGFNETLALEGLNRQTKCGWSVRIFLPLAVAKTPGTTRTFLRGSLAFLNLVTSQLVLGFPPEARGFGASLPQAAVDVNK